MVSQAEIIIRAEQQDALAVKLNIWPLWPAYRAHAASQALLIKLPQTAFNIAIADYQ
jgi:hypothetical protein